MLTKSGKGGRCEFLAKMLFCVKKKRVIVKVQFLRDSRVPLEAFVYILK